jgi:hypothetical protein
MFLPVAEIIDKMKEISCSVVYPYSLYRVRIQHYQKFWIRIRIRLSMLKMPHSNNVKSFLILFSHQCKIFELLKKVMFFK